MHKTNYWLLALWLGLLPLCKAQAAEAPSIDPAFCRALIKHEPAADVTYQPGVDTFGRPVAPADLDDSTNSILPDVLTIPLTVDLSKFLAVDMSSFPFNTMTRNDINLGTLTLRGDKVYLNDKPLSGAQQDNLAVLCLKPTETKKEPINLNKKRN